jgi:hypothetical protein
VAALDALAGQGLVPPLRLVVPVEIMRHPPHLATDSRAPRSAGGRAAG